MTGAVRGGRVGRGAAVGGVAVMAAVLALSGHAQEPQRAPRTLRWTGCGITKQAFMAELAAAYKTATGVDIVLSGGGATRGIRAVGAKEAELGGTCRHTLDVPEERSTRLIPIAWDALCVIVNRANPVDAITTEQLDAVFAGRTKTWSQLGAPEDHGAINVHAREGRISGVGYMARLMIFHDKNRDFAAAFLHPESGALEPAIEKDPRGIGMTGISSAHRRDALKILSLNGVRPSPETIKSGAYPFVRPLYLTVHADYRTDPDVVRFVLWARSPAGQSVIKDTGAVPASEANDVMWQVYGTHMRRANEDLDALWRITTELAKDMEDLDAKQ